MAYIDEQDLYSLVAEMSLVHKNEIDALPRADVIPRSEVDEIIRQSKVAIFAEIEKYFCDNEHKTGFLRYSNFFNLKKKYTEGEE